MRAFRVFSFFSPYRDFLRLPDVARLVFAAFISRLPVGMAG